MAEEQYPQVAPDFKKMRTKKQALGWIKKYAPDIARYYSNDDKLTELKAAVKRITNVNKRNAELQLDNGRNINQSDDIQIRGGIQSNNKNNDSNLSNKLKQHFDQLTNKIETQHASTVNKIQGFLKQSVDNTKGSMAMWIILTLIPIWFTIFKGYGSYTDVADTSEVALGEGFTRDECLIMCIPFIQNMSNTNNTNANNNNNNIFNASAIDNLSNHFNQLKEKEKEKCEEMNHELGLKLTQMEKLNEELKILVNKKGDENKELRSNINVLDMCADKVIDGELKIELQNCEIRNQQSITIYNNCMDELRLKTQHFEACNAQLRVCRKRRNKQELDELHVIVDSNNNNDNNQLKHE